MKALFHHQITGIEFLKEKVRAGLWDDMGLGKTAQAILAMKELDAAPVLVVCPASLCTVWSKAIEEWYLEATVTTVRGAKMHRIMQVKFDLLEEPTTFIIISYELLHTHLADLCKLKVGGLIFDEAHRLKNRKTKTHKAASLLSRRFLQKPLFTLSGTPILNRTEELYSMLHVIDPVTHSSFWRWAEDHLTTARTREADKWKVLIVGGPRQPEAFKSYVSQFGIRRIKEDCIDLPAKIFETVDVHLDGAQLKAYKTMRDQMYMRLSVGNMEVGAPNALSAMLRLKQIAVSTALVDSYMPGIPGAKLEVLEELMESSGDLPVVVFSQFADAVTKFHAHFERKYPCSTVKGDDSYRQRDKSVELFQDGKLKALFISTLAGGVGLTLTAGKIAVFTDLLWTPALNNQAIDRLHRIGQEDSVMVYSLKAVNTIEDYILNILGDKQALFDASIPVERMARSQWKELLR